LATRKELKLRTRALWNFVLLPSLLMLLLPVLLLLLLLLLLWQAMHVLRSYIDDDVGPLPFTSLYLPYLPLLLADPSYALAWVYLLSG